MTSVSSGRIRRQSVALIGMRGAGKTSVGIELARLLNLPFLDTDQAIERSTGRSIADIFAVEGEPIFRAKETATIRDAASRGPHVISVGGGAVLDPKNVDRLKEVAVLVWLRASVEVLWERISTDLRSARTRPALTELGGLDELRTVLLQREPLYQAAADWTFDTDAWTPSAVAQTLRKRIAASFSTE